MKRIGCIAAVLGVVAFVLTILAGDPRAVRMTLDPDITQEAGA